MSQVDNLIFFFVTFQLLQIGLSIFGFQGIKWLENIGSGFILLSLMYMFYSVISKYGDEITTNLVNIDGTWGAPFWAATMLFLGIYSTMMLNVSDYSRELKKGTGTGLLSTIYAMSILPCTLFMGLITMIAVTAQARGYQMADASYLAVFEYSFLVSAAFCGWVFCGQSLDALSVLGMVAIAISGTVIAVRTRDI